MVVKTKMGDVEVADARVEHVFGNRVLVLRGEREELARAGVLRTPWLVWHAKTEQYHRYSTVYDVVLAGMNARDFEGILEGNSGDLQKMLTCLARLDYLHVFAGNGDAKKEDVDRMCDEVARGIGQTFSDTKKQVLRLVAAATECDGDERVSRIAEAIGSTRDRLREIAGIDDVITWQTNVLLARLRAQMKREREIADALSGIARAYADGKSNYLMRATWEKEICAAARACTVEFDVPIAGLVMDTRKALMEAHRIRYQAPYMELGEIIRQRRLAHTLFLPFYQINRIIYRISWAQRSSKRRAELFVTARREMLQLIATLEMDTHSVLSANPASEAILWARNAAALASVPKPDWGEVKDSLRSAAACYGR